MFDDATIVAIATANGIGSISIVRISGANALAIASKISKKTTFQPRLATLSYLYDTNNEIIDEALVLYFKAPFSFTGEDVVEFQCHGGVAIANMIVDEVLKSGARLANPGEFSKRAFFNNKIDLSKAEAISKIIEARSADAVKLLARQLKGELTNFVNEIREDLLFMLAYTEVSIDYAEEDLPTDIYEQIENKLQKITLKLSNTLEASRRREGMIEGFKVAIIGKPNVGKSSLLNKLLNYDRAIISDIAGTTRDTIEESVKIGTHIIKIVDTAGIRNASDVIEKIGIEKSIETLNEADIVIALFDNSKNCDDEDKKILELINENSNKEIIKVLNKSDLDNLFDKSILNNFIELSTKEDINPLIKRVEQILDSNTFGDEMTLISKRQVSSVENTLYNINLSKEPLSSGELEFFAHFITEALENISSITRPYENDEMLDVMFGEFCLGK
ncbi:MULTISPECIES: tRNA uridine-5-carboxymethylaminomethyl(34) synthesis GTPase MnmE [Arcobacter]|uniref:tRNA modification GTPase MnmE n=1 Tax=Arcobacter ellisii TaxID=913109 RepID=A0A347U9X1_9BACT|nr:MULTISPECIES: tRNA uridine-5-carboxymethylaminomethyl(34) synthesis GTPase MnmE [Arcobacter]AXX95649.1 5-carboxymethylaminomethyluridine-tRNA synthase MnmEG, GTPase component [Arcobacter ellisii]MDD3008022.1 tRNA uridine-5-carboxymethylaminomethyl(34) synthesis GTPase MnmE [Arcobacter sp.]MDY3203836.1 tRNA uridine-5-carboxymethylaminomethyl(34) synthesis GTPase MnmE [Arcobacter sp.]RXI31476.1 tRNA uridine-5-carboxymethylaminomethyl(34) synthesis GTPase MnmE [Arcobacter ellisii]